MLDQALAPPKQKTLEELQMELLELEQQQFDLAMKLNDAKDKE